MSPDEMLQQAVAAAQAGDAAGARRILSELVRQHPREARAWYLLSQVVEQPERAEYCLKKVLEIDPQNAKARQRLETLKTGSPPAAPHPAPHPTPPPAAPEVRPARVQATSTPAPAQPAASPSTTPGQVKLPPWLATSPEQAAPIHPLVEPPASGQSTWLAGTTSHGNSALTGSKTAGNSSSYAEREVIQGIPSTYKPPEIPGAIEAEPPAEPVRPAGAQKAAKKRKEKKDYFGVIWWVGGIVSVVCVCCLIAFMFGPQILLERYLGSQLGIPGQTIPGSQSIQPADSYRVMYKIEGTGPARVSYTNSQGKTISKSVNLPYTNTMTMPGQSVPSIMAQSLERTSTHCAIEVNGTEATRDTMRRSGITMCYVQLP